MSDSEESGVAKAGVLNLDLRVTYDLNGASLSDLRERLRNTFDRAFAEGDITGSTDAEVEEYALEVISNPDDMVKMATRELVEGSGFSPEVASIVAKYGMMNPSDFVEMLAGSEELLRGRELAD